MSVSGNVAFPLEMRRVSKGEAGRAVDDALELVGMKDFANRFPAQLSGGQQQRVALARAIVFRPSILLMDEPFGALDRKLRERLQMEIRRLQRQLGLTVIFVTHDQEEAMSMSDRIVLMNNGRIVQEGTARQVYESPNSHFSASFMGENNLLEATAVRRKGDLFTVSIGGTEFDGTSDVDLIPGSALRAFIRAEKIRIGPPERSAPRARVVETTYVGSTERLVLRLEQGLEVIARTSSAELKLAEGDLVSVSWDPSDLRLIR
jgi:ABC-type Fe3+/spermidine/putrescine transport system ATPase subunit